VDLSLREFVRFFEVLPLEGEDDVVDEMDDELLVLPWRFLRPLLGGADFGISHRLDDTLSYNETKML
jgi:hypothetical protein